MSLLKRRYMMSLGESDRLPSGYQEVESIRKVFNGGSNNAYIDSGINASYDLITEFEGKSSAIDSTDTGSTSFFGSRVGSNNEAYQTFPFYYSGGSSPYQYFNTRFGNYTYNYGALTFPFTPNTKFTMKFGNGEIYKDGTKVLDMSNSSTFTSLLNVYIFATNNNGSVGFVDGLATLDIYEMKMSRGGVLLRHFIPCYRKSDSEVGLYDLVSQTFFTNQGSGEFLAGVSVLSKKQQKLYQQVEYIETDGNQYINTGISDIFSNKIEFEFGFAYTQHNNVEHAILGSKNSNGQGLTIYFPSSYMQDYLTTWCGSGTSWNVASVSLNTKYSVKATFNVGTGREVIIDNTTYTNASVANNAINNGSIFGLFSDSADTLSSALIGKIYYWKCKKDGVLVADFIPCYRKSDNEIDMLDVVNNVFYENEGSGSFTKGNDV